MYSRICNSHSALYVPYLTWNEFCQISILSLFSTSVESRTEKLLYVRTYVRTMPLILANSYQITSILHTVLSTITVSVFIEKKNLNRPSPVAPAPFLGILGCFSQKLWGIGFSPFETFRFEFLYFWHL